MILPCSTLGSPSEVTGRSRTQLGQEQPGDFHEDIHLDDFNVGLVNSFLITSQLLLVHFPGQDQIMLETSPNSLIKRDELTPNFHQVLKQNHKNHYPTSSYWKHICISFSGTEISLDKYFSERSACVFDLPKKIAVLNTCSRNLSSTLL